MITTCDTIMRCGISTHKTVWSRSTLLLFKSRPLPLTVPTTCTISAHEVLKHAVRLPFTGPCAVIRLPPLGVNRSPNKFATTYVWYLEMNEFSLHQPCAYAVFLCMQHAIQPSWDATGCVPPLGRSPPCHPGGPYWLHCRPPRRA